MFVGCIFNNKAKPLAVGLGHGKNRTTHYVIIFNINNKWIRSRPPIVMQTLSAYLPVCILYGVYLHCKIDANRSKIAGASWTTILLVNNMKSKKFDTALILFSLGSLQVLRIIVIHEQDGLLFGPKDTTLPIVDVKRLGRLSSTDWDCRRQITATHTTMVEGQLNRQRRQAPNNLQHRQHNMRLGHCCGTRKRGIILNNKLKLPEHTEESTNNRSKTFRRRSFVGPHYGHPKGITIHLESVILEVIIVEC